MSTPHPLFTVTLSGDQLATLRAFLDYAGGASADLYADLYAALDAAKPVRATKPRAPRAVAKPFTPNTGNAAVDEFMRWKHDPKYRPLPLPKSPGLPPLRPMKVSEQDAAEAAWKHACNEARDRVACGEPSEAEMTLRDLIAIHRNPWRLETTVVTREGGRTRETRVLTSPRHPGVAIHEIHERGSWGSGDASTTWHVVANGELSEKVHYAAQAAELEADALA